MPDTIYKNTSNVQFMKAFKSIDTKDTGRLRQGFRELYSRDIRLSKNIEPEFCQLAKSVCVGLIKKSLKINDKYYNRLLTGDQEFVTKKDIKEMVPYLLRKAGKEEYYGIIRFSKVTKKKDNFGEVFDVLPFEDNRAFVVKGLIFKVNEEKRRMFSKIFPVNKIDLQGDMATEEDLAQALIMIAKNGGMDVNLEHKEGTVISDNDAIVMETFQIKKNDVIEGMPVNKGDLVSTVQFFDTPIGRSLFDRVKSGEFKSFSMEGTAERVEV